MANDKNELGHIYGSRISKNGKWLNLIIRVGEGEKGFFVTCPLNIVRNYDDWDDFGNKPYAELETSVNAEGVKYECKANIVNVPIYAERKEAASEEPPKSDDLPF